MAESTIMDQLAARGVVPVIAIESADAALPMADAMIAGGLPVAEITFRTDAAADVIKTLTDKRPDMVVGAGTVLTVENVQRAFDCGARFAVSPGFNPAVVAKAMEIGLPFSPGVATPSDIEGALALGCRDLKFFPAGALGGVNTLKAISAPYKHLGVRFVPTGGVSLSNMAEYLALDSVLAVGGTWVAKTDAIAAGDWDAITANCAEAVKTAAAARS